MAKYMLIMRSDDASQRAFQESGLSFDDMLERMGRYNDALIEAGVLVAAEGLEEPEKGVVVDYSGAEPVVTDGPYGETKELFNGYWILDVDTIDDAVGWAKKAPLAGPGMKAEIRRIPSIDEFPQDNEWVRRERAWRERTHQL
ncbi:MULTISPECIES: YciI family protein [unclassified Isoptericola]|uniref:YciI family protein n=1 Tax=unclassified Isoptericola TaxID=2623355 RepID=UPI00366876F9